MSINQRIKKIFLGPSTTELEDKLREDPEALVKKVARQEKSIHLISRAGIATLVGAASRTAFPWIQKGYNAIQFRRYVGGVDTAVDNAMGLAERASQCDYSEAGEIGQQALDIAQQAEQACDAGNYQLAIDLSREATELANNARHFQSISDGLQRAESLVQSADELVNSQIGEKVYNAGDLGDQAVELFNKAEQAFDVGNYDLARDLTQQARGLAQKAQEMHSSYVHDWQIDTYVKQPAQRASEETVQVWTNVADWVTTHPLETLEATLVATATGLYAGAAVYYKKKGNMSDLHKAMGKAAAGVGGAVVGVPVLAAHAVGEGIAIGGHGLGEGLYAAADAVPFVAPIAGDLLERFGWYECPEEKGESFDLTQAAWVSYKGRREGSLERWKKTMGGSRDRLYTNFRNVLGRAFYDIKQNGVIGYTPGLKH